MPLSFTVLNSGSCRSSVTTSPEPFTVSLPHPFKSMTMQPDAIVATTIKIPIRFMNLVFISFPFLVAVFNWAIGV
jgi:hypothetical protein